MCGKLAVATKKIQITIIQPSASTTFKHTATQQPQLEKEHTHFFVQKFINKIKLALNWKMEKKDYYVRLLDINVFVWLVYVFISACSRISIFELINTHTTKENYNSNDKSK